MKASHAACYINYFYDSVGNALALLFSSGSTVRLIFFYINFLISLSVHNKDYGQFTVTLKTKYLLALLVVKTNWQHNFASREILQINIKLQDE